jgi:hypothetical protein
MQAKVEQIGVERAVQLLAMVDNGMQRNLSANTVDRYAADMAAGMWKENGDAVRISASGKLVDGRHRLSAIIKSGCQIRAVVITGLDDIAIRTIDRGKRRTMRDVFRCAGFGELANNGEVARLWVLLHNGNNPVTDAEILQCAVTHSEALGFVGSAFRCHARGIERAPVRLAAAELYERSKEHAESFVARLSDGEQLANGNPILTLRNYLLLRVNDSTEGIYEKAVAACLAHMQGRQLLKLYRRRWNAE